MDDKLKEIIEKVADGKRNGNGYMAWVENAVLDTLLDEVKRLQGELDAAVGDIYDTKSCKLCKHCSGCDPDYDTDTNEFMRWRDCNGRGLKTNFEWRGSMKGE